MLTKQRKDLYFNIASSDDEHLLKNLTVGDIVIYGIPLIGTKDMTSISKIDELSIGKVISIQERTDISMNKYIKIGIQWDIRYIGFIEHNETYDKKWLSMTYYKEK